MKGLFYFLRSERAWTILGFRSELLLCEFQGVGVDPVLVTLDVARHKLPQDNFCLSIVSQLPSPQG